MLDPIERIESAEVDTSMRSLLEQILSQYAPARSSGSFGRGHPIRRSFVTLKNAIESLPALRYQCSLRVEWSVGKGNWAAVPWLALIDSQEVEAPGRGVYCIFLIRKDMTGVYSTLNQGVTKLKQEMGAANARRHLKECASRIQAAVPFLRDQGFDLHGGIDLRCGGLGADYADSTIAHKLYGTGHVPKDPEISEDIELLLRAYAKVSTRT